MDSEQSGTTEAVAMRKWSCGHCGELVEMPDGASLRRLRERLGLEQKELAFELGCERQLVSMVELNARRPNRKILDWAMRVGGEAWAQACANRRHA